MKEYKLEEFEKMLNFITGFKYKYFIINVLKINNFYNLKTFQKELEINLLDLHTKEEKILLIRHYVSKLCDIHIFYEPIKEFTLLIDQQHLSENDDEIIDKAGNKRSLGNSELHIVRGYNLFLYLIYEIQRYCQIYEIDLFNIFTDFNIPLTYITDNKYNNFLFREVLSKSDESEAKTKINPSTKKPKNNKSFLDYFDYENSNALAEAIKNEFIPGIGKELRLILEVLNKHNLFSFGYRKKQAIYEAMTIYFNREIGSKQSIFDCKFEMNDPDFKVIETKILNLLKKIESNK
jgi:hypothetical protein